MTPDPPCRAARQRVQAFAPQGEILPQGGFTPPEDVKSAGSPQRLRCGAELRWMPEYTTFSTLDTRYDEDE